MLFLALLVLAPHSATHAFPFEITSNKPFVHVSVNGSAPQWFVLDSGNSGNSMIARECGDRLHLEHDAERTQQVGAGSGAEVRLATARKAVTLQALGETLSVAQPLLMTLEHVSRNEGRRVDGLLGSDFLARHVVEIDYARSTIVLHDPNGFEPPAGAEVIPLDLSTGWPVVQGGITLPDGSTLPCRLIIDTGVRFPLALFRPFSARHSLHESAPGLDDVIVGVGAGGASRGDVARLAALSLGPVSFAKPIAVFSRDTTGVFAQDGPDGIVGGELLRRKRVTFDYPHARMILQAYATEPAPFEHDMSGLYLGVDAPAYTTLRIVAVSSKTPAAEAGLRTGDEILSMDGKRTPALTLDGARALLRVPGTRRLEIRRGEQVLKVQLAVRRLV
jgi:hypothetical protein